MNIVIVGGGTAGWLTALYAKKVFNSDNIILIESEKIGILGAGEGASPNFDNLLNFLDIPFTDIIKNCNATIKTGIKFTNWSKNKNSYFHPFFQYNNASNDNNFTLKTTFLENDTNFCHYYASLNNENFNDYALIQKASDKFLVPYIKNSENNIIEQTGETSLHFDARLLASYLRSVGEKRNIIRKEGIVEKIFNNKDGYINKIKTNKETIKCDFVFDCSGFNKLIIGKHYKGVWKSYSEYLPTKKAIPFFLKMDEKIPPYTEAIAMNFGWMWKTPLQNRYGCGYVFDSNYISDEDAIKEIEKHLGFQPEYPLKQKGAFTFFAGSFENIWIKNCLAVGLSSGFIEPLEATSITQTINILRRFLSDKQNIITKNENIKEKFNYINSDETQKIVDFIYLHFVTNKKNNTFWKNFTKNNKMPKQIEYILSVSNDKVLNYDFDFYNNSFFGLSSFHYTLIGNEIIDRKSMKKNINFSLDDTKKQDYQNILNNQKILIPKLLTHNELLDIITKGE